MSYIPPPTSLPPGATVWTYLRDSGGPSQGESIDRCSSILLTYVGVNRHAGGHMVCPDIFPNIRW